MNTSETDGHSSWKLMSKAVKMLYSIIKEIIRSKNHVPTQLIVRLVSVWAASYMAFSQLEVDWPQIKTTVVNTCIFRQQKFEEKISK